ncbi:MAG: hypothetical protein R3C53_12570 [Pirellulaceae bacterium]
MNQDHRTLAGSTPEWDADDVAILSALQNVGLPQGAEERLRMRLANSQAVVELAGAVPNSAGRLTRRLLLALAAAAAIASIAFFFRSHSTSREQLTAYCIDQLELLSNGSPQWELATREQAANDLESMLVSVKGKLQLVGVKVQAAGPIADSCRVWKFMAEDGKSFYVFDFQSPRPVQDVSEQLGAISRASGGWSLAAIQGGNQLLVAAVHGNIERYFEPVRLA